MAFHLTLVAAILLGAFGWAGNARALNGTDAAATAGYPFVGRVQTQTTNPSLHVGTGSYITNGVVLTAAHTVNLANNANVTQQTFERFSLNGVQYFGLGVQDPLYNPVGLSPDDVGLMLLLNAPGTPAGGFPTLGSTNLVNGDTATVVGFTDWTTGKFASNKRSGTVTMNNAAVNVTANLYNFTTPTSASFTQGGDSGGPLILNGQIIGTVRSGNSGSTTAANAPGILSTFVRVDSHTDFITGNGQNMGGGVYQATLDRLLQGTGNTTWSAAASWGRASTNFAAAPQANDVAILDPTVNSDAGTVVTLDVDTANLNGLLNDTTLNLNGHALNVTGTSGALNGGVINVTGAVSVANIASSIDNEGGTITIAKGGVANIGGALPTFQTAVWNGSNGTIAVQGGGLLSATSGDNSARIINGNSTSVITVGGDATGGGTITTGYLDNYGTVAATSGGLINLNFRFINNPSGQLQLSGGGNGDGTASVFRLLNAGTVSVANGGVLIAGLYVTNMGPMTVSGGSVSTPQFAIGFATNFPSDPTFASLITATGSVTMTSGNIGITNALTQGLLDVQTGTFTMNGGNLSVDRLFVTNATTSQFFLNGGVVTSSFMQVANGIPFTVGSNAVAATLNMVPTVLGPNTFTFSNGMNIAVTADSTGTVVFSGNLLLATNSTTTVCLRGTGQMVVSNAGSFYGNNLVVASTNGAQGTFSTVGLASFSQLNGFLSVGDQAGATGTVFVGGGQLVVTNSSLTVGNAGVGQMIVSNGTVLAGNFNGPMAVAIGETNGAQGTLTMAGGSFTAAGPLRAGDQAGANGAVWVTGGTLTLTNAGAFIGNAGVAQMTISNGTVLANTRFAGMIIGYAATAQGTLTVAGGTNDLGGFTLANSAGATGVLWVTGGQLTATNLPTLIGNSGVGQMIVSNGFVVAGNFNGPQAIVAGVNAGSQGTLTIAGGSNIFAGPLRAGDNAGAMGAVWVTGGLLNLTNAGAFIGNGGTGQMTVSNGTVLGETTIIGGRVPGSVGSLTVAGGTFTTAGYFPYLHVGDVEGATGAVLVTGGSLAVTNGSTVIGNFGVGQLTISNVTVQTRDVTIAVGLESSGTLTLNNGTLATSAGLLNNTNGFVKGVGTIAGDMTNAGTISPGFSPGKIFITGKLTLQPTSTVVMELGGTADADYDHIIISNALQADGTLNVSLINSFAPADGNTFDIFGFTSASGQFAITNLPALNPGLSWDTSNLMTMGELAVVPEPSSLLLVFAGCSFGVLLFRRRSRRDT